MNTAMMVKWWKAGKTAEMTTAILPSVGLQLGEVEFVLDVFDPEGPWEPEEVITSVVAKRCWG